jgi:hypothetical protein
MDDYLESLAEKVASSAREFVRQAERLSRVSAGDNHSSQSFHQTRSRFLESVGRLDQQIRATSVSVGRRPG